MCACDFRVSCAHFFVVGWGGVKMGSQGMKTGEIALKGDKKAFNC